ncbi:MAG: hypothetical protein HC844_10780 [Tabrizicola sp.]|nr:hypothetical protein [Tabrizicola sp.]
MTIAAPWGTVPVQSRLITVMTGAVVSRGETVTGSGSVYNGQGGISVSSIPDIWLRDDDGQEHHVQDHLMGHCREGHRVAVFWERHGKRRLIAMANLSTDQWYGRASLMEDSTPGTILFVGFLLAIALAIPVLVFWAWFVGAVTGINLSQAGIPDWYWSGWMILVGSSALLLSWKIQSGNDERRRALRVEIGTVIDKLKAKEART